MSCGIDSRIISGDVPNIENSSHAWNQVKIGGKWYNVDLTWDAERIRSGKEVDFFLINDEEFYKTHRASNVDGNVIDYISSEKRNYKSYYDTKKEVKPFECKETYDKKKIADFFGYEFKFQSSKKMIDDISSLQIGIDDIKKEAQTIVDVQKAAVLVKDHDTEVLHDEK